MTIDNNAPCVRGHIGQRNPKTGKCKACSKILNRERYLKNAEKRKADNNAWYHANKEKAKASMQNWRAKNPETCNDATLNWQAKNKERMLATAKEYREKNKKRHLSRESKRRAAKLLRSVKWANLDKISEVYLNCPDNMQVDHIIPLQGALVSGLHVENNLQYLSPLENISKNNKFDPWTWEEPICSNL